MNSISLDQAVDRRRVLSPTTWRLDPGAHGLIGPNGSGKTTLLRAIAGLTPLRTGSREVERAAMSATGGDVAFVGDRLRDHFATAALVHPHFDHGLAGKLLGLLGASPGSKIRSLSVGQRQLAAVATALASRTPVMLLDEPFNGLDVTARDGLRAAILGLLQSGPALTVVLTSHRAEDLAGVVEDVTPISGGVLGATRCLEDLRPQFPTLSGPEAEVRAAVGSLRVLHEQRLGGLLRATLAGKPERIPRGVTVEHPDDAALIDSLVYQERNQ